MRKKTRARRANAAKAMVNQTCFRPLVARDRTKYHRPSARQRTEVTP